VGYAKRDSLPLIIRHWSLVLQQLDPLNDLPVSFVEVTFSDPPGADKGVCIFQGNDEVDGVRVEVLGTVGPAGDRIGNGMGMIDAEDVVAEGTHGADGIEQAPGFG